MLPPRPWPVRPLSVLHFTDSLEPSGVGQHIVLLAQAQQALGYRPALACPDVPASRSLVERCVAAGMAVFRVRVRDAEDTADFRRLVGLLRSGAFDLFHNHCGITWEGCWGSFAAAEAGVPALATEHLPYCMPDLSGRALKLRATRALGAVIAVSHGCARTLLEAGVVDAGRLHVVWNGVDPLPFALPRDPAARRPLLGFAPEKCLLVALGRLTPQKGHATLLDAVAIARRRVRGLRLVVAGDGPLRPQLEAQAGRLGLSATVRFVGRWGDVPALLACADVLVQPSTFEGHPLAVLEAMAAGLPAVVTDTTGTNETVEHERSGLVVSPESPSALAEAITSLALDPQRAARLGAAARVRLRRHFTAEVMAGHTDAVYRRVLRPRAYPPGRQLVVALAG